MNACIKMAAAPITAQIHLAHTNVLAKLDTNLKATAEIALVR